MPVEIPSNNDLTGELFPGWRPKVERCSDIITPAQANRLAATLDEPAPDYGEGDRLPPLWHWIFTVKPVSHSGLGKDGHPRRGDFLPPVTLPRRLFAGMKTDFLQPLIIGLEAERKSEVIDITKKSGASGDLLFVRICNSIRQQGNLCVVDEQEVVYRDKGAPVMLPEVKPFPEPAADSWTKELILNAEMLFRFSAVTFNSHRIHYDRIYAAQEEGYPALVVHAPLIAMLLLQLVRRNCDKKINRFEYRALAPLFDGQPVRLCAVAKEGGTINMKALRADGKIAAQASCHS